ncbi:MAG: hypothetical protein L0154_19920 [Chloroflexi bacterium]|nr:hypothetical protein [Chloroflexota bacterium]
MWARFCADERFLEMSYLDSVIHQSLTRGRAMTLQMGRTLHIMSYSADSAFLYHRLDLDSDSDQHYVKRYDKIDEVLNLMENLAPLPLWLAKWS